MIVASLVSACSGPGTAQSSPSAAQTSSSATSRPTSASPLPTPSLPVEPSDPAWGVLVSALGGSSYTVSLVGIDGTVVASAQAATPNAVRCGNGAAAVVPAPVSTSNTRVYFMDGSGVVRFLAPNGDTGRSTTVPVGPARRSMFAVSPDDKRIAVIVADFTTAGASSRLYVEDLNGGGHHIDPFSDNGGFMVWPTGWGGTSDLVLAKVPACAQGTGPWCCGPLEFHVVDSTTAVRRVTLGGPMPYLPSPDCRIVGPPSPAGATCEDNSNASIIDWNANQKTTWGIQGFVPYLLSPSGKRLATTSGTDTSYRSDYDSSGWHTIVGIVACGWIDNQHLLAGGDVQHQPRVADLISGAIVPVSAQGDCAGRIPGIL
jgi:hypothetical protein